jgi:hypothetical protein
VPKPLRHWKLVSSLTKQVVPTGSTVLLPDGTPVQVVSHKPPTNTSPEGRVYVRREGDEMWEEVNARGLMMLVVPG